jgi:hypothetical protein
MPLDFDETAVLLRKYLSISSADAVAVKAEFFVKPV